VRDAIDQLKQGKTLDPMVSTVQQGAAEVLYGLGSAGNQQGDELAAMIYLRLALHLDPQHAMAMVTLGDILERLKQHERAIEVYNLVPKTSPVRASADIQIGLSLEVLNRGDDAVKQLEQLIAERPADVDAMVALGNVYRSRKKYPESAEAYTKALAMLGEPMPRANWTWLYFRGIAFERSKDWPKAEADFKRALELAPESQARERAVVLNYLGYSWVDQGIHLDEGFQMLKQAVDLRPRDGYIVDSLGWAYYRLARYEDAVRELEKAIDLKPSDPTINDHLGDAYWKVGRKLEAKFQWNHARDLNPEAEDLEKILKKIEFGMVEEAPAAVGGAEKEQKDGG
jgi:tetratricopeptide (TPR) repeat protein